jgi:small-conductance mechanosensitive channel
MPTLPGSMHYNYRGLVCSASSCQNLAMVTSLAADRTLSLAALQRRFGRTRFLSLLVLSALLVMCLAFSWITRDAMVHLRFLKNQQSQNGSQNIVDQHPWQIAQALAPLAVSSEEVELAHEAERLADHDVDQAFASALRQANAQHTKPSGDALEMTTTVARLQQMTKEDQARVKSLTAAAAGAGDNDDLKIAQAQLDLEQDELNDAQHDLARASGDVRTKIQQELAAHQAAVSKRNTATTGDSQLAVISTRQYGTLAGRLQAWFSQRSRYVLIQQAMQQAKSDMASLTLQHNALEAQANATTASAEVSPSSNAKAVTVTADKLASLQQRREQRQLLSIYDDRIQTQQQLEGVYSKWGSQVQLQHRIVMHMAVRSLASIALILIVVIMCEAAGATLLERQALDRRRMQTLRLILRLTVQIAGILAVLLVTFGVPKEISTIVGLATAGLTVALQSFILAFVGWFILMGRNGMRVGDWVEINGVAGEVTAIDLFRTTILETSDWAAKGHPTGRRATFINNFAVSGQFFNFSTVGQWMWDEVSVSIPASPEVYEKVAQINSAVLELTRQNAELAEEEWKRIPRQNALSHAHAGSSVNMRPAGAGIEILIRYVTRATDRLAVRNSIYEQVLALLHKPQALIRTSQPSQLTAAVLAAKDPSERDVKEKRHSMYT